MIDPTRDIWVWLTLLLLLVLMGLRACVVELSDERLRESRRRLRSLNGAVALTVVGLVVLLTVQGGTLLVTSIVNGTEPNTGAAAPADPPAANPPAANPPAANPAAG